MPVTVRLFAGLRERAGWARREVEGLERVADVWPALELGEEPGGLLYAVNRRGSSGPTIGATERSVASWRSLSSTAMG